MDEAVERTGRRCRAAAGGGDVTADSTCGVGPTAVLKFLNRKGKAGQETTDKQVLMR